MKRYAGGRAQERIEALAMRAGDVVTFWREAGEVIEGVVPHFGGACWYTLDPASLLITSHFNAEMPQLPPEWLAEEYYGDDVHKLADVVRSTSGVSTLHEATGGDPSSSPRWHANMTLGGDQELILALRTGAGERWGGLGLYREPGQPLFDSDEIGLLRALAPSLAEAPAAACSSARHAIPRVLTRRA
jgi:hypothetical protein